MRLRTALAAVPLLSLLAVSTGAPAQAAPRVLKSGVAVTAKVSSNRSVSYTWAAVKGRHVTFDVRASKWVRAGGSGYGYLSVYDSRGGAVDSRQLAQVPLYLEILPRTTGTYKVVVSSVGGSSGSAKIIYGKDLTGTLTSGRSVVAPVRLRGRHVVYSWAAVKGRHVTFDVRASKWVGVTGGTGYGYLSVYDSKGGAVDSRQLAQTANYLEILPRTTGRYTLVISSANGSIGSAKVVYAKDVTGKLTAGTARTATITYRGQHAVYSFTPPAGTLVVVAATATSWVRNVGGVRAAGYGDMTVYDSAGGAVDNRQLSTAPASLQFTAGSGRYTVVIASAGGSTGSATISYR